MPEHVRARILTTERLPSSKAANPRYTVTTDKGSWPTVIDGAVGYGISNPEYRDEVTLTIERGQIIGVCTLDGKHSTGRLN
jgi:hypothetical protein